MRIAIIILVGGLIGLASCKKYEGGPRFSIRTKSNRIGGTWEIQSYTIDGADSLEQMGFETHNYLFGGYYCSKIVRGINCSNCSNADGEWYFVGSSKKNKIYFNFNALPSPFTHPRSINGVSRSWTIVELRNKKLVLRSDPSNGPLVVITFNKTDNKQCE